MTDQEKITLKRAIVMTAAYYRDRLPDEVILMYVADLEDLPVREVLSAYHSYRRDPKNRKPPIPADIRSLVLPEATPEDFARQFAASAIAAVAKHGLDWPAGFYSADRRYFYGGEKNFDDWKDAVEEEFGSSFAHALIQRFGGWVRLYEFVNTSAPTVVNAQLRDFATSAIRVMRAQGDRPIQLSEGSAPKELISGIGRKMD